MDYFDIFLESDSEQEQNNNNASPAHHGQPSSQHATPAAWPIHQPYREQGLASKTLPTGAQSPESAPQRRATLFGRVPLQSRDLPQSTNDPVPPVDTSVDSTFNNQASQSAEEDALRLRETYALVEQSYNAAISGKQTLEMTIESLKSHMERLKQRLAARSEPQPPAWEPRPIPAKASPQASRPATQSHVFTISDDEDDERPPTTSSSSSAKKPRGRKRKSDTQSPSQQPQAWQPPQPQIPIKQEYHGFTAYASSTWSDIPADPFSDPSPSPASSMAQQKRSKRKKKFYEDDSDRDDEEDQDYSLEYSQSRNRGNNNKSTNRDGSIFEVNNGDETQDFDRDSFARQEFLLIYPLVAKLLAAGEGHVWNDSFRANTHGGSLSEDKNVLQCRAALFLMLKWKRIQKEENPSETRRPPFQMGHSVKTDYLLLQGEEFPDNSRSEIIPLSQHYRFITPAMQELGFIGEVWRGRNRKSQ